MNGSDQSTALPKAKNLLRSLVRINANKGHAVLHLTCGAELSRVFLQAGEVVHVDGAKGLFVGDIESPTGRLDHDIGALIGGGVPANEAMSLAATAIGKFLVEMGARSDCNWGLRGGENSPDSVIPLPIGMGKMLMDACVDHLTNQASADNLEESTDKWVRVRDNSVVPTGLPPLSFRAYRSFATGAKPLHEVLAKISTGSGGLLEAKRAVDLLLRFGLIEFSGKVAAPIVEPPPVSPAPESPASESPPPESVAVEHDSGPLNGSEAWTVESLEAVERKFARQPPLQIFGLISGESTKPITTYDVRSAFRRVAADFHPDRFSGSSEEVRGSAERVFAFLNHARSKIESQEDLDRAVRRLMPKKSKGGVVTEIDRTKAKGHLRTAEARMRHGKWGEAREFILQAIEQVPEDTSYQIIEIFCRGVMKSITYVEAAALIEALETDTARQHAEKYFRSGWLYKLSGNTKKARDRFNKALAHDPNHVDSSREFRMLGKRSADAESKRRKEESQLPFARFFKKKK